MLAVLSVLVGVTFKPGGGATVAGTIAIVAAALAGLAGVVVTVMGYTAFPEAAAGIRNWQIVVGGIVLYVVLMFATYALMKRPITTELFLILGFGVLELSLINSVYGSGAIASAAAVFLVIMVLLVVVVSMICYMLFYQLEGTAGWIDGMIPLIGCGVFQIMAMVILLASA